MRQRPWRPPGDVPAAACRCRDPRWGPGPAAHGSYGLLVSALAERRPQGWGDTHSAAHSVARTSPQSRSDHPGSWLTPIPLNLSTANCMPQLVVQRESRVRRLITSVTALALAALLAVVHPQPATAYPPDIPSKATVQSELNALVVRAEGSSSGYSRDLFPHWISQGNNCNTREVVLRRDGSNVQIGSDCYPPRAAGTASSTARPAPLPPTSRSTTSLPWPRHGAPEPARGPPPAGSPSPTTSPARSSSPSPPR
jgi:hypothetical protein